MLTRFKSLQNQYPRQFWLLFWGMLLNATGASMVWPFLLLYVSKRLDMPLTSIATLLTLSTAASLVSSFIAGPIADRVGRKGVMVFSLFADAVNFLLLSRADSYAAFAAVLAARGFFNPMYRVGADAMLADLIPERQRPEAYALARTATNAGVSIGPALGGFLAGTSYVLSFYGAAISLGTFGVLLLLLAKETLPFDELRAASQRGEQAQGPRREAWGGYPVILRDRVFLSFIGLLSFGWITASLMWQIMPYYANTYFGVPEKLYGWVPTTNALMVVFLQVLVTRFTRPHPPQKMVALGILVYGVSNGMVALAGGFWGFWVAMAVMTIGELIAIPTSNTYVANTAPSDMRGRYMSIYGLVHMIGVGVGPVFGGAMNDYLGPKFIWLGGLAVGLVSAAGLYLLSRVGQRR
ncbi:MAG: MFS transporter [Chloroflexota bacterium]